MEGAGEGVFAGLIWGAGAAEDMGEARLGEGPGGDELGEGGVVLVGEGLALVEHVVDFLAVFYAEKGVFQALVAGGEGALGGDFAGEEALAEGRIGEQGYVLSAAVVEDAVMFDFSFEHAEFFLGGVDGAISLEVLDGDVGDADGADFSLFFEFDQGSHGVLDGGGGILPVGLV